MSGFTDSNNSTSGSGGASASSVGMGEGEWRRLLKIRESVCGTQMFVHFVIQVCICAHVYMCTCVHVYCYIGVWVHMCA